MRGQVFYSHNPANRLPGLVEKAFSPNFNEVRKPPTDADWLEFMAWARGETNTVLGKFYRNLLTADQFGDELFTLLRRAHRASQVMGRQRAGVLGGVNQIDEEVALFHMQEQGGYLTGFVADLIEKHPRYWDEEKKEWKKGAITRRAQMYNSRLRGTASIAFEANSGDDAEFYWRLGPAEHCEDCLDLAARSPWKKNELPVFPGDGGTDCIVQCKCWLERGDGATSFPPDPGVGKAEVGEEDDLRRPSEPMDAASTAIFTGDVAFEASSEAEDLIKGVFGEDFTSDDLIELVAAPGGSKVQAELYGNLLRVSTRKPEWGFVSIRTYAAVGDGSVEVQHDVIRADHAPPGTGTRVVARQLVNYRKRGFRRVHVHAAKGKDWNGYYLWPVMGFLCNIPEDTANELDYQFDLTDVMDTHEIEEALGDEWAEWWKEYGGDTYGIFELQGDTKHWGLLLAYLKRKGIDVGQNSV